MIGPSKRILYTVLDQSNNYLLLIVSLHFLRNQKIHREMLFEPHQTFTLFASFNSTLLALAANRIEFKLSLKCA